MAKLERERKFLVCGDGWRCKAGGAFIRQAYLSTDPERTVRVRLAGDHACITIKGKSEGSARPELEYSVPLEDTDQLFSLAKGQPIEKRRYRIEHRGHVWEVDEFVGANAGLVLAEIEVADEDALERAVAERPNWTGLEVTSDHRFANSSLAERPFTSWPEEERTLADATDDGKR